MNNARDDAPIGVFDSGVGGLTVARAIIDQLPNESITYVGDTANCPYGPRPIAQVRKLALNVMDRLVADGVKMLVIACNSASAAVLHDARERYTTQLGIPVIEVIRPAARSAVRATRNGKIGVIATQATIKSGAYDDALLTVPDIDVFSAPAPRFVEFAEAGITTGAELISTAQEYLEPIKSAGVDTLVLGCTHYPFLSGAIGYVMGEDVLLVSSADETAKDVYRALTEGDILRSSSAGKPVYQFNVTGESESFQELARRFLGPKVTHVAHVDVPRIDSRN
ncbi:glutamate racemase [Arcanobacterium pinnipediorum]|uniref:Glutamate racemase n=1 Tax=Arcanobacterium pinnipediorum TaxID=1503041 RepID=A0ABY5AG71_9ACTO|nr:glutamate racemase [Arcanobacterium pinnipediorum]USR78867.1 glutamate racemase [Arcanobacterium pinnipediorum]